ncbi:MAG: class I SAM-dependent methyltransferase [Selenomonadaceae bacterium]|nr:class I SAM-dependent methyltransferase [Selenomonadaceae bacterium]
MNLVAGSSDFERGQYEALKSAYRLFGHGDLMKFWLFEEHRCIYKWAHYFPIYEKWFEAYRGKEIVFVEVGVQNGGSIQMWHDYFGKDAKIVGIDIIPVCKQFEDPEQNIFVEIGSQDDPNFWAAFKEKYPRVDILLDDGGHQFNQQILTFREMFPHIKDGGLYMCEDCHTSYAYSMRCGTCEPIILNGGVGVKGTFIEFTKNLIDEINAFHTNGTLPPNYNTLNMGGIHFYDSVVVVEKKKIPFKPFDLPVGDFAKVNAEA